MDKKAKIATISAFVLVLIVSIAIAVAAPKAPKQCNDGIDNDGDTYTDYPNDPGCSSRRDNSELNPNIECDDGTDNDGDTYTDYPDDAGCGSPTDNDETDCGNGVCEGGETPQSCPEDCITYTCDDTDGGIVYDIMGTVSGIYYQTPYSYDDYCQGGAGNETNEILVEYYCRPDNKPTSETYDCNNGNTTTCSNGACV